ncbi:helix-turn-helix domain-containing protein [Clostridium sp. SHJSY1]|uniref:helix-turn-helix domain-containing protein n=1 Tax=Clostridium sp. SHJSY1 TaxID=2942483 RepID=UPI0028748B09|nr:helix-turn-helix transcriptional regulator [Clostridium sp. SHJSY1]MDS0528530.1 helix-turn-helix domain-containing protein [Clostridium sp. SHJSY1]
MNNTATFREVFEDVNNPTDTIHNNLPANNLAEKIHKLRLMNGLTKRQLAINAHIGYSSICKYENGHKICKDNLMKLCNYFNLDLIYFQ